MRFDVVMGRQSPESIHDILIYEYIHGRKANAEYAYTVVYLYTSRCQYDILGNYDPV